MTLDHILINFHDFSLYFVKHVDTLSILSSLLVFFIIPIKNFFKKKPNDLVKLINAVLAAGSIPVALALFLCSLDNELVKEMSGMSINLLIAGIALLVISILAIKADW